MSNLKDMKLFAHVVEQGSFAKAAKVVGITPAMVGRRIASMEQVLGFILLNRSTRRMQLTPGGKDYYEGIKRIVADVEDLETSLSSVHQDNPIGMIRLSAPDGLGEVFLLRVIKEFRMRYPEVRFDLNLTNKPLDLIEERIDLSLRLTHALQDSSLIAALLKRSGFSLYASREYLDRKGYPENLADLENHDCLHMGDSRYGDYWNIFEDGKMVRVHLPWVVNTPNTLAVINATAEGVGIAAIPDLFIAGHRLEDKLVRLKGVVDFPDLSLYALYPSRKYLPYRVTLFLDFLKQWIAANGDN
jgi:DNA-binding transcriptional LysR family regulator